jgi:hypothetical protein
MIASICVLSFVYVRLSAFSQDPLEGAVISGLAASVGGAALAYYRKLYSGILDGRVSSVDPGNDLALAGTAYFVARPIFAALFSLVFLAGGVAGLLATSTRSFVLGPGLVHFMAFAGFFLGFAAGEVLTAVEARAREWSRRWSQ